MNEETKKPKVKVSRPKIIEKKLGRDGVWGWCYDDGLIEIDPRQQSKRYLNTIIHEMLHHHFPQTSETEVTRIATIMANVLWKKRYRRIEK